jgi:hypothetical protein
MMQKQCNGASQLCVSFRKKVVLACSFKSKLLTVKKRALSLSVGKGGLSTGLRKLKACNDAHNFAFPLEKSFVSLFL